MRYLVLAAALFGSVAFASSSWADTETGQGGAPGAQGSAGPGGQAVNPPGQLPRCAVPLNTIALVESQIPGLAQYGLTSPVPVLRLMIQQSNCFTVVDRGQVTQQILQEQQLSGGPAPRLVRPKYYLTPNILFQNKDSGGLGGVGGLIGGIPGAIIGGIQVQKSEAQVLLNVTDGDTGIQIYSASGSAKTEDVGFALGGGGGGGFGGLGAYENTDIGKTVTAALLDAYIQIVNYVQQTQPPVGAVRQGPVVP